MADSVSTSCWPRPPRCPRAHRSGWPRDAEHGRTSPQSRRNVVPAFGLMCELGWRDAGPDGPHGSRSMNPICRVEQHGKSRVISVTINSRRWRRPRPPAFRRRSTFSRSPCRQSWICGRRRDQQPDRMPLLAEAQCGGLPLRRRRGRRGTVQGDGHAGADCARYSPHRGGGPLSDRPTRRHSGCSIMETRCSHAACGASISPIGRRARLFQRH